MHQTHIDIQLFENTPKLKATQFILWYAHNLTGINGTTVYKTVRLL